MGLNKNFISYRTGVISNYYGEIGLYLQA